MSLDQLAHRTVADRHAADRYWQERATSQITFARDLGREHPSEAAHAGQLADRAEATFSAALVDGTALAAATAQVEQILAPLSALAKTHVIDCVGHAHIDMNWMWGWHETVAVTGDTVRTVLQLLAEFPEFHFSQSQASIYRILERHHPDLLAALKPHIASGRWEVTASHWVEGDRNCGSGEAMTRHLLQTRAYFRDLLGLTPEQVLVDWVPDCFGHAATIPAFDARGGVRHYYCWRTGATDRPPAFRWQAPDGSEILVQRELDGYNGMPNPGMVRHLWTTYRHCGLRGWMMVYGIGDHGGGPTRRHIRRIIDMDAWPVFPRWRFARSGEWFAKLETVRDRLPLWTTELNSEYSGCLVSQAAIKRNNRAMENALAETDGALALAQRLLAHPVPQPRMDEAWRTCLFGHFHDILPGSGVRATREYSGAQCQEVLAETMALSGGAWRALTTAVDTSFVGPAPALPAIPCLERTALGAGAGSLATSTIGGNPVSGFPVGLVAFNPVAHARQETLQVRVWEGELSWDDISQGRGNQTRQFRIRLPDGKLLPAQRLGTGNHWNHQFVDLAVPVRVGALGWQAYAIEEGEAETTGHGTVRAIREVEGGCNHPPAVTLPSGRLALENDILLVEFDKQGGGISRILDRASGRELLTAGAIAGQLECLHERAHPMSAWITGDTMKREQWTCETLEVVQQGPWLASVRATVRLRDNTATLTWSLAADSRQLHLAITLRWLERGGNDRGTPRVALLTPCQLGANTLRCEIPGGSIVRELQTDRLQAALRWVGFAGQLGDGTAVHWLVANDGVHSHRQQGDVLAIDLVRSSYDPDPLPELGDHAWSFTFQPQLGALAVEQAMHVGQDLNHPLRSVLATSHAGALPSSSDGLLTVTPATVVCTQLKAAADGDGLIVRLQETAVGAASATITLADLCGRLRSATAVDLLERGDTTLAVSGQKITVPIAASGMATLRLRFAR